MVGPKLPLSTFILEILDVPLQLDGNSAAESVAFQLHSRDIGAVWDIWKVTSVLAPGLADSEGRRQYSLVAALVPTALPSGQISATTIFKVPGYLSLNGKFNGRPDWCTRCKSDDVRFHVFGQCKKTKCFHCKERRHIADQCPKRKAQVTLY